MLQHNNKLVGFVIGLLFASCTVGAEPVALNPAHPDRYVVQKGDTLWDIAGRFLRDPWLWPEIWHVNQQIDNPHLIFPGDAIVLTYVDGQPRIGLERGHPTIKLSPQIRSTPIDQAIPTIPVDAIQQFLTASRVVDAGVLESAPYVVAIADEHLVGGIGVGDRVYVRAIDSTEFTDFTIFRPGGPYIDPDTGEILGYEAAYIADSALHRTGDPATLLLTQGDQEVRAGDRLLPTVEDDTPLHSFVPHAPDRPVEGRIISVFGGLTQIGSLQVVAISLGERDGMETGHVLAVDQAGERVRDEVRGAAATVRLPDEEAGLLIVFRTFDRLSLGLVVKASKAMHLYDFVRTPGT